MAVTTRKRFFQIAPLDQQIYTSIEVYNADIGLKRWVINQVKPKSFQLEATAPRNAGETVEFIGIGGVAPEPEQGEFGASLELNLGAVGQHVNRELRKYTDAGRRSPTEVIWRQHLSGVALPSVYFYFQLEKAIIKGRNFGLVARQVNTASRNISRRYKADEFIGLSVSI